MIHIKKNIIIAIILLISLVGCRDRKVKPDVIYRYIEPWQAAYIPYKLGDTLSFTNELNGNVIHYKCTQFERKMEVLGDSNECPPNMEFCSVHVDESLKVGLQCLDQNEKNFILYYTSDSPHFQIMFKKFEGGESLITILSKDSSCGFTSTYPYPIAFPDAQCIGTASIGGRSYSHIAKLTNTYHPTQALDTIYYNETSGLLRFCLKNGDQWNKN